MTTPIPLATGPLTLKTVNELVNAANALVAAGATTDTNGSTTGAATGVTIHEIGGAVLHKTIITLTNVTLALTDDTGVGAYGSAKIYTLPVGFLQFSAVTNLTVTKSSAGVSATWSGKQALGDVAAFDGSLNDNTETLFQTGVIGPAVAGVQSVAKAAGTLADIDVSTLSGAPPAVFLNFSVDDADETVDMTPCNLIVNGTITLVWANLGNF